MTPMWSAGLQWTLVCSTHSLKGYPQPLWHRGPRALQGFRAWGHSTLKSHPFWIDHLSSVTLYVVRIWMGHHLRTWWAGYYLSALVLVWNLVNSTYYHESSFIWISQKLLCTGKKTYCEGFPLLLTQGFWLHCTKWTTLIMVWRSLK